MELKQETNSSNSRSVADLLVLQQRLRSIPDITELAYFLANEASVLLSYQTAVVFLKTDAKFLLKANSGLPTPVPEAPFTQWIEDLQKWIVGQGKFESYVFNVSDVPEKFSIKWRDYVSDQILWTPLLDFDNNLVGSILYTRKTTWEEEELRIIEYWTHAVSHALVSLQHRNTSSLHKYIQGFFNTLKKKIMLVVVVLTALVLFYTNVPLTVLAPAEIVPKNPKTIRAPLDGIIDELFVTENQSLKKGDLLFSLEKSALRTRLDIATQELAIALAEYRRAEQTSVFKRDASVHLPVYKARVKQKQSEYDYVVSLLDRINVVADHDAIVIISDSDQLEGKPVQLGERIMVLARENSAELELWLPVSDSIFLKEKAKIVLFLNVEPELPRLAQLEFINYQAEISPEGILAFRARAELTGDEVYSRIGWRGTAKLYGETVPLYYYLFRRPYSAIRQWMGV